MLTVDSLTPLQIANIAEKIQKRYPTETKKLKDLTYPLVCYYEALKKYGLVDSNGTFIDGTAYNLPSETYSVAAEKVLYWVGEKAVTESTLKNSLFFSRSTIWDKITGAGKWIGKKWASLMQTQINAVKEIFSTAKNVVKETLIWAFRTIGESIAAAGQALGLPSLLTLLGLGLGGYLLINYFNRKPQRRKTHGS